MVYKIIDKFVFCIVVTWLFVPLYSKHFILISAPGSGKGTFSQYMSKKYGYVHIGLGDILRTRIDNHQSTKMKTLNKILKKYILATIKSNKKFILDNAIISQENWQMWKDFFYKYNLCKEIYFIALEASDETCLSRMKNRLICRKCFHVFKRISSVSLQNVYCKECGHKLSIRKEDHDSQFLKKRFQSFHDQTQPLIEYLKKTYRVVEISSEQSLEDLYLIYDQLHFM